MRTSFFAILDSPCVTNLDGSAPSPPCGTRQGLNSSDYVSLALVQDLGDDTRADGQATFADSELGAFFERDRHNQFNDHAHIIAGHDHLDASGQFNRAGHIHRADVELRTVAGEERLMTPTLVLA